MKAGFGQSYENKAVFCPLTGTTASIFTAMQLSGHHQISAWPNHLITTSQYPGDALEIDGSTEPVTLLQVEVGNEIPAK